MFDQIINHIFSYFIIYTKLIQWTNIEQNTYIGKKVFEYCKRFTNNAPYVSSDINYKALDDLKEKCNELGLTIDISLKPINSGTISLIFFTIIDNKKCVIKLKRIGVYKKVDNVLKNLLFLSKILSVIPIVKNFPLNDIVISLEKKFIEQVDFEQEAVNIDFFENTVKHNLIDNLMVNKQLSNSELIVTNYIDGKTIYDLTNDEKRQCLQIFVKTSLCLIFIKKIVHLDCHPGNIIFIKNDNNTYKIAYIDLGLLMKICDMEDLDILFNLSKSIGSGNTEEIVSLINTNTIKIFGISNCDLVKPLCDDIKRMKLFTISNTEQSSKDTHVLLILINKHQLKLSTIIYNFLLHLISVLSIVLYLDKNNEYFEIMSQQLEKFN